MSVLLDVPAPAADHVGPTVPRTDDGSESGETAARGASSDLGVTSHGFAESLSVPVAHGSHIQQWNGRYTRREPSLPASIVIAAWAVVDAWLVYGAVQWLIWAL